LKFSWFIVCGIRSPKCHLFNSTIDDTAIDDTAIDDTGVDEVQVDQACTHEITQMNF